MYAVHAKKTLTLFAFSVLGDCVFFSLSLSLSLSLPLSLSFSLFLSLPPSLSPSLSPSLPLSFSLSLWINRRATVWGLGVRHERVNHFVDRLNEHERHRPLYVCLLCPCLICMPYMYALCVCLICTPYMYAFYVRTCKPFRRQIEWTWAPPSLICMPSMSVPYMYALHVCLICMPYMYALYVCLLCTYL